MHRLPGFLIALLLLALLQACSISHSIPDDRHILQRNRIEVEEAEIKASELKSYLRQQPNRRILGFYRFHLQVYQLASRGSDNRLKRWMRETIGEPPVLHDPVLAGMSRDQLSMYMHSKGYFLAETDYEVRFRGKKAWVNYHIRGNTPYTLGQIQYLIPDAHLASFVYADTANRLVSSGQRYDAQRFQQERNRIARMLREEGFYGFSRDFIFFRVDSSLGRHMANLRIDINNPISMLPPAEGGPLPARHRRYRIEQIEVFPEYSPLMPGRLFPDTTLYSRNGAEYIFIHEGPMRIRPRVITHNIMFEPGNYYHIGHVEQTYANLTRLRNFRAINIQFSETRGTDRQAADSLAGLVAKVQFARQPANSFTIETEGLNTAGKLGVAGNLVFMNRNLFKGAEIINLRLTGALEASGERSYDEVIQRLPFNTLELGAELGIDVPKLLFPIAMERLSRQSRPKSTISTGINYRQRPDYTRYILNFNYGFEWTHNLQSRHTLTPFELSSIKLTNDSLLQARLPEDNLLIASRFRDHLIMGTRYSYVFSSQEPGKEADFIYLRTQFELAGNLLSLASRLIDAPKDHNQSYRLMGIPFAQFAKIEADYRYYRVFNANASLVMRLMGGAGLAYGNTRVLPFIRSFYGGGANGLRAWPIYNLGPGSYQGEREMLFDRYGDIKLETNIEYRFAIYRFWHAGIFLDAGNVWFMRDNPDFPGGVFRFDRFVSDLAAGTGLGLRLDFNFFVVRVDAAFPLRDPSLPANEKWIRHWPGWQQWNFNLGIGYPF